MTYTPTPEPTMPLQCTRNTKTNHYKTLPATESIGNSPPHICFSNNSDINRPIYKLTGISGKTHPSNTLYLPSTLPDYQPKIKSQMKTYIQKIVTKL